MADGDLWIVASDEPPLTPAAERILELLEPLTRADESGLLHVLADVLAIGIDPIWHISEHPGAGAWLTPQEAPAEWLPWLARIVGARISAGMSEQQRRLEIAHPAGHERGRAATIRAMVDGLLTGSRLLVIREQPYHLVIRTRLAETPDPPAVEAELRRHIPAGHVLDFAALEARDWTEVAATWPTWGAARAEAGAWHHVLIPDTD